MEKPELFKNSNIIGNNKESCLLTNIEDNTDIENELNKVFNSFNNIYNTKVRIITRDRTIDTYLMSRTKNNIMTINREIIPIKEIIDLKVK